MPELPAQVTTSDRKPGLRRPGLRHSEAYALALAALLPVTATAQLLSSADYLARMDGDGDGRVSLSEYQEWLSYAFEAMDRNRDGVLTADELPGGKGAPVTRADHRARLADAFHRQDHNRDGFLDARELAAPPQR